MYWKNLCYICICIVVLILFLLTSCDENNVSDCMECTDHEVDNFEIAIGGLGYDASLTTNDSISTVVVSENHSTDIDVNIDALLGSLNISTNTSQVSFGLALFYDGAIDASNFTNLTTIVHYYYENSTSKADLYDYSINAVKDSDYSRKNFIISALDFYRISINKSTLTENILLLMDQTNLPVSAYFTDFQTQIDSKFAPISDPTEEEDGSYKRKCDSNPDCDDWDSFGTCTFSEHQSGGVSSSCLPHGGDDGVCATEQADVLLISTNTPLAADVVPRIYKIRNEVLLNDKFEYLIDDYYYLSTKIASDITLSMALDFYSLSNTNFFDILENYSNASYSDSVLISTSTKTILVDLCNDAKSLTTDSRSITILNSTISKINSYAGKTIAYIKAN